MVLTFAEGVKLYSADAECSHVLYIVTLMHVKCSFSLLLKAADCLVCILAASDSLITCRAQQMQLYCCIIQVVCHMELQVLGHKFGNVETNVSVSCSSQVQRKSICWVTTLCLSYGLFLLRADQEITFLYTTIWGLGWRSG
jgi:hypothetical protein